MRTVERFVNTSTYRDGRGTESRNHAVTRSRSPAVTQSRSHAVTESRSHGDTQSRGRTVTQARSFRQTAEVGLIKRPVEAENLPRPLPPRGVLLERRLCHNRVSVISRADAGLRTREKRRKKNKREREEDERQRGIRREATTKQRARKPVCVPGRVKASTELSTPVSKRS